MNALLNIIEWLKGKKTYLVAFVAAVFNFGIAVGWWTADNQLWVAINMILASFGLGTLRAGIKNDK
jgi:hypothetical protein